MDAATPNDLTEAQLERISKIETYGDAAVSVFSKHADGSVDIEIRKPLGSSYQVLDANGRIHDHAEGES